MSTVWRLVTHHINTETALRWTRREERIAIGWGDIGDIRAQGYQSVEDIGEAIKNSYPKAENSGQGSRNLWDFYSTMQREISSS